MSDTKRKIFIIIVLVLVLLFGVGQFFAYSNLNTTNQNGQTNPSVATVPTQVIAYAATTPATSTPVESGSCFASSVAAPYRADAWRCSVGNAISDPCFEIPSGVGGAIGIASSSASGTLPQLLCGTNPALASTSSTFVLKLKKSLPAPEIPSSTPTNWAWLVQLNDGTLCTPFTGTRPFSAAGDVATYACNGSEGMIFGDLNDASATWFAEVGSLSTATSTFPPVLVASATVPVAAVWQ